MKIPQQLRRKSPRTERIEYPNATLSLPNCAHQYMQIRARGAAARAYGESRPTGTLAHSLRYALTQTLIRLWIDESESVFVQDHAVPCLNPQVEGAIRNRDAHGAVDECNTHRHLIQYELRGAPQ
jgi:hypothetical protein